MYVTLLSSTCFGPWHVHPQEEQLHKHSIWYPRSHKRLYTTPVESRPAVSTGVVYSRLEDRGYQMLCLCSCSSWGWTCQGPKHVEDGSVTYMLLLNCTLKLVNEIILYYNARSKKHQNKQNYFHEIWPSAEDQDSSVGIVTCYGLEGPGIESWPQSSVSLY